MKMAVIVIDIINDFVTGVLKCERAYRIIPNIQRLLDFEWKEEIPIIYTNDAHLPDVDKRPHAIAGTWGVVEELKP